MAKLYADDVVAVFDRDHHDRIDDPVLAAATADVFATGEPRSLDYVRDGRQLAVVLTPVGSEHVCAVTRDVTETRIDAVLRAAASTMSTGLVVVEVPSGRLLFKNTTREMLEASPEVTHVEHYRALAFFDATGAPLPPSAWPLTRAMHGETVVSELVQVVRADQLRRVLRVNASPVRDAHGAIIAAITTYFEITDEHRASESARYLAAAGKVLAHFDPATSLQAIVDLAVPQLADYCFVHLVTPAGAPVAALAHADPAMVKRLRTLAAAPVVTDSGTIIARILAGGPPEIVEIDDEELRRSAPDPARLTLLRELGMRSAVFAGLPGRDGVLGALIFVMAESGRTYTDADREMLAELARRTGLALDNARLFAAEQDARRAAEVARDHARRLQELTSALSSALAKHEVTSIFVDAGRAALDAQAAYAWLLTDPLTLELSGASNVSNPEHVKSFHTIPMTVEMPVCDAVRTREPMLFENAAALREHYPRAAAAADTAYKAWAVIPLVLGGRGIGAASFSFDSERRFTEADRRLLVAMSTQASLALERCRLSEAHRRSEEQLRNALIAARAATWTLDLATMESTRDPSYEALVGRRDGAVKADFMAIHPEDRDIARTAFDRTLREGVPYEPVVRLIRDDGTTMWIQAYGRLTADDAGRRQLAGVIIDIDDAKLASLRADEERRISDTLHRLASSFASELDLDRLVDRMVSEITAAVGAETGSFVAAESARQLPDAASLMEVPVTGRSGELFGWLQFQHPDAGQFTEQHQRLVTSIASQASVALENARLYKAVRDHKEQLEEAVERAHVADRRKDEFLAMLGHELRNPLAPMSTALDLMDLKRADNVSRERDVIRRQVRHMSRLIEDLLDVSRITRGKIQLDKQTVALSTIVAKAIELASPLIERRMQRLDVDLPRDGLLVDADATRLAQVFQNLLTNASKYSDERSTIEIRATATDSHITATVTDHGVGIAPELMPRMFEMFVQGERTIDRTEGGLGIGLTIARSLCELHGGTVTAASPGPGRGSTFSVTLPVASRQRVSTDPMPPLRPRGMPATRVLVVDDNIDAALMLRETLAELGHELEVAHDGPSALELAATFRPDIAVLDIGLPVMSGYELARKLREQLGSEKLRLIAVTGYGQDSDKARARAEGFDHHLIKPIELDALLALLAK